MIYVAYTLQIQITKDLSIESKIDLCILSLKIDNLLADNIQISQPVTVTINVIKYLLSMLALCKV